MPKKALTMPKNPLWYFNWIPREARIPGFPIGFPRNARRLRRWQDIEQPPSCFKVSLCLLASVAPPWAFLGPLLRRSQTPPWPIFSRPRQRPPWPLKGLNFKRTLRGFFFSIIRLYKAYYFL